MTPRGLSTLGGLVCAMAFVMCVSTALGSDSIEVVPAVSTIAMEGSIDSIVVASAVETAVMVESNQTIKEGEENNDIEKKAKEQLGLGVPHIWQYDGKWEICKSSNNTNMQPTSVTLKPIGKPLLPGEPVAVVVEGGLSRQVTGGVVTIDLEVQGAFTANLHYAANLCDLLPCPLQVEGNTTYVVKYTPPSFLPIGSGNLTLEATDQTGEEILCVSVILDVKSVFEEEKVSTAVKEKKGFLTPSGVAPESKDVWPAAAVGESVLAKMVADDSQKAVKDIRQQVEMAASRLLDGKAPIVGKTEESSVPYKTGLIVIGVSVFLSFATLLAVILSIRRGRSRYQAVVKSFSYYDARVQDPNTSFWKRQYAKLGRLGGNSQASGFSAYEEEEAAARECGFTSLHYQPITDNAGWPVATGRRVE